MGGEGIGCSRPQFPLDVGRGRGDSGRNALTGMVLDLMSQKLLECLNSERDRMTAVTLLLAYPLGKPKQSIEQTSSASALPALSAETLSCLVQDMQIAQAPVIDVEAMPAQSDNPSDSLTDG